MASYPTHYRAFARKIWGILQSEDRSLPYRCWPHSEALDSPRAVDHFVARRMAKEGLIVATEDGPELRVLGLTSKGRSLLGDVGDGAAHF